MGKSKTSDKRAARCNADTRSETTSSSDVFVSPYSTLQSNSSTKTSLTATSQADRHEYQQQMQRFHVGKSKTSDKRAARCNADTRSETTSSSDVFVSPYSTLQSNSSTKTSLTATSQADRHEYQQQMQRFHRSNAESHPKYS